MTDITGIATLEVQYNNTLMPLSALPNLMLDISNNELLVLPPEIGNLTHLTSLRCSGNLLHQLPQETTSLKRLRELDCRNNALKILPENISKLRSLRRMDVAVNRLRNLPESIVKLNALQHLDCSYNELEALPENIRELPSLEHFVLTHNKLHKLPNSIGDLKRLQDLKIGNNQLIEIPEALGDLPSLSILSMSNSKLQQLPGFIAKLDTLRSLDLSYNELGDLPDWLSNIQLTDINLSNNRFATVPSCIFKMPVETLYLSSNQLHFIPDAIGSMPHLLDLNLMNNRLVFLPGELGDLPSLQALNVAMNHLTTLPRSLENIPNFVSSHDSEMNASYNPLTNEEVNFWKEKMHSFEYVTEPVLSIPLERLIIGEFVGDFTRLVNLANLGLTSLDVQLLKDLQVVLANSNRKLIDMQRINLDLSSNTITILPETFFDDFFRPMVNRVGSVIPRLVALDISDNNLVSLPEISAINKTVKYLNIAENKLDSLPESIVHLAGLRRLATFGNNFTIQPLVDMVDGKEVLRGIYYRDASGKSNLKINAFLTRLALLNGLDFLDFKQEYLRYSGIGSPLLDHLRRMGGIIDLSTVLNRWQK